MEKTALLIPLILLLFAAAFAAVTNGPEPPELVQVCEGQEFPEGPACDGRGNLYFSNCNSDYITKVAADGTVTKKWMTAAEGGPDAYQKTNGMAFYQDGTLYACDFGRNAIVRIHPDTKKCELVVDNYEGKPLEAPNDLAFDPHGNLYFTAPGGSDKDHPTGPVYRLDHATKKLTRVAEGMAFPNGLAFTADAKFLYVCESERNRIVRFAVKEDGSLGPLEPFADLSPDGPGAPDGMAVDAKGHLWITHYGAHTVLEADTHGKIVQTIRLPHKNENGPTNIEFAGKDLKTVYVTDPGDECLWKFRVETPGLPLFCSPR